jgi:hypothetical protein
MRSMWWVYPTPVHTGLHRRAREATPGAAVSAWTWPQPDVVPVVVTAVGADGTNRYWLRDLRSGRDKAERIELPEGALVLTIIRPVRERVDLGQHRSGRRTPQPARPTWRDDSSLIMWWRAWRAERAARRAMRRGRRKG